MHSFKECLKIQEIVELAEKLARRENHLVYPLVFRLIIFAMILPVATKHIENIFSNENCAANIT